MAYTISTLVMNQTEFNGEIFDKSYVLAHTRENVYFIPNNTFYSKVFMSKLFCSSISINVYKV